MTQKSRKKQANLKASNHTKTPPKKGGVSCPYSLTKAADCSPA